MVRKADGTWRPCGDYRRLNNVTKADRYPVPNIQDFTARLHGCSVFSKLDLLSGPGEGRGHTQDGGHHSFWSLGVSAHCLPGLGSQQGGAACQGVGVHQVGGQQASSAASLRGAISSHQGGPEGVCGRHRRPPPVGHGGPAETTPRSRSCGPGRTAEMRVATGLEDESSTVQPAFCKRGSRLRGACVADSEKIPQVNCM
jgi:hypothetical protein